VLVAGGWLTVLVAVLFDLYAGEAAVHAATLGAVAAVTAYVRIRTVGRNSSLVSFVAGCVVSQPAMHYGITFLPHPTLEHGSGAVPGAADLLAVCAQILLILALAAGVSLVERAVVALTTSMVGLGLRLIRTGPVRVPSTRRVVVVRSLPAGEGETGRYLCRSLARRGPPPQAVALFS